MSGIAKNRQAKALGRGLGALLPSLEGKEGEQVVQVRLSAIRPNPYQPRRDFDQARLDELAQSIREHGVLQPVILRQGMDGQYEIVAGERRCRAAKIIGMEQVPAVLRSLSDALMMQVALVENVQRENLNPIEEAHAYKELIDQLGWTQEELGLRLGKSRSAIANTLRLLGLRGEIQNWILEGRLTAGHARAVLQLDDHERQMTLAGRILDDALSVREAERLARGQREVRPRPGRKRAKPEALALEESSLQERLQRRLDTRVRIRSEGGRGRIEIEFYNDADLSRLVELLVARDEPGR